MLGGGICVLLMFAAVADDPEPPVTRDAVCNWATTAPEIDGKIDDPAWKSAAPIERFAAFWDKRTAGSKTKALLLWDDQALYFAGTMSDSEIKAFGSKRNDKLWFGDVFELFLKPAEARPEYYEFQVNPKSVILELAFPKRGFDFETLAAKPPLGFTAAAAVNGTLDEPGDKDESWTVEGKIPWTVFESTGGRPKSESVWRFAICRYDYGAEGTEPLTISSAPLTKPSFHRYEDYGKLTFRGAKP